ncbi:hypothetical protein NHX12_017491, partial [Muraenolepis orangiensis]
VGGFDGEISLSSAEAYSPAPGAWRPVPSMISARGNFCLAVLGELLYVVGGHDGLSTTFNAERYDDEAEQRARHDCVPQRAQLLRGLGTGRPDPGQKAMDEQQDVDGVGQAVGAERTMSARTCNIFNKLRLNGELCDLVIEAEGVAFNAHKIILCGCSPYFR